MKKTALNISVGFYIGDFRRSGGTERSCVSVVNALSNITGYKVYLITTNKEDEMPFFPVRDEVNILYLDVENQRREYISLLWKLKGVISTYNMGVLVAVEVYSLLFAFPSLKVHNIFGGKVKLVVWEHFNFTVNLGRRTRDFFRKLAAKYADAVVVLTKRDVELWQDNLRVKAIIRSIGNASPFAVSDKPYNVDSKVILAVGRLSSEKGFDLLIEIWGKYVEQFGVPKHWKVLIVGSGPDERILAELIEKHQLSRTVEMVPNTSDISDYYQKAAILAMTSRFEGLPMTLIEAQSFGLPIISYDCLTGPSEIVSPGTGFLVEVGDSRSYVSGLDTLIKSSELRLQMSKSAKVNVRKFSIDLITQQWVTLIESLIK